jgi:F-box and WD-40 domain protein 7
MSSVHDWATRTASICLRPQQRDRASSQPSWQPPVSRGALPAQDWATSNNLKLPSSPGSLVVDARPPNIHSGHDEIVWALERRGPHFFSASADKSVRVWCPQAKRCTRVLEGHARPVLSLASTANVLFSGSYDNTIKVWSLDSLQCYDTLKGHIDAVRALATVGDYLFSGSYDHTLRAWSLRPDVFSGELFDCDKVLRKHTGPVRALAGLGGLVFSGSYDNTVCCWSASVRAPARVLLL